MGEKGLNKCMFIGRLGSDPEIKFTRDNDPVANFSIAVTQVWTPRGGGEQQKKTEWVRIVAFKKWAEICRDYLKKGSRIYLEAQVQTRSWEGNDGRRNYMTEFVMRDMNFIDLNRGDSDYDRDSGSGSPSSSGSGGMPGPEDDDIPF